MTTSVSFCLKVYVRPWRHGRRDRRRRIARLPSAPEGPHRVARSCLCRCGQVCSSQGPRGNAHPHPYGQGALGRGSLKKKNLGHSRVGRRCGPYTITGPTEHGEPASINEPIFSARSGSDNLNKCDLDREARILHVCGKGRRDRFAFLEYQSILRGLDTYLTALDLLLSRSDGNGGADCALFLSRFGERISSHAVRDLVAKRACEAGVDRRITPHIFRHTFAMLLLERDVDIRYIQEFLGHKSIKTTERYASVSPARLRLIMRTRCPADIAR